MKKTNNGSLPDSFEELCDILKPVATNGIPGNAADLIDIGNGDFIDFFNKEIILSLVSNGGSSINFFEGNIGSGKSHISKLIEKKALNQDFAFIWIDLKSLTQIAHYENIVREILQQITIISNEEQSKSLPLILKRKPGFIKVNSDNGTYLPHKGCKTAIEYVLSNKISNDNGKFLLDQYLMGSPVTIAQFRQAGITGIKNSLSTKNAENFLKTALNYLYSLRKKGLIIVFDIDTVFENKVKPPEVKKAANILRRLIDATADHTILGCSIIFTAPTGFLNYCSNHYPALGQRIRPGHFVNIHHSWRAKRYEIAKIRTKDRNEIPNCLAEKIGSIMAEYNSFDGNLINELNKYGEKIMMRNAGEGYIRPLVHGMTSIALNYYQDE